MGAANELPDHAIVMRSARPFCPGVPPNGGAVAGREKTTVAPAGTRTGLVRGTSGGQE